MASTPVSTPRPAKDKPQSTTPLGLPPDAKIRAQRFEEAHAWVLENHARTFEKLAK